MSLLLYIISILSNYVLHCFWLVLILVRTTIFLFIFVMLGVPAWRLMQVYIQYNGGLLPDIIMLTQCYYHRGTRLNAIKRFCLRSL